LPPEGNSGKTDRENTCFVQWQSRFAALVRELRARSTLSIRKDLEKRMELSLFRFLFVPGFHYRTDPSSGADFAGPRTYLRNCGFDTQLVEVEEDGTIEQNAAFIAAAVRKETSAGKRLIIVSTSIGGPETAVALGKLLSVDDLRPVAAWISVGGLLGGTVLADQAERWPMSWLAKLAFLFKGIDARAIPGMTTVSSRRRMTELRFLKSLLVLDYHRRAAVGPDRRRCQGPLENARAFRSQRWLNASR
jgi:hypothetical protein